MWWDGGIAYDLGRRGGKAITEDIVEIVLFVLNGASGLEETWWSALRRGEMVMYMTGLGDNELTDQSPSRSRG
jgi:hypothetical protein